MMILRSTMICRRCLLSLLSTRKLGTLSSFPSSYSFKVFDPKLAPFFEKLKSLEHSNGVESFDKNRYADILHLKDKFDAELGMVAELESMKNETEDAEMVRLADLDLAKCAEMMRHLDESLVEKIIELSPEADSSSRIILEVSSGAGGQEAMLFTSDIFRMYEGFAAFNRWNFAVLECLESPQGGIRHAAATINGPSVFKLMMFEAGIHRVQRVPATEKTGRMHTSTSSVIIMPEPEDISVVLNNRDIEIEVMRASGPGGQHVNTTESAVRVKHIPSGIAVECQSSRSQGENRQEAMRKLSAILYQKQLDEQGATRMSERKLQVGSKSRSEKIRTYNFQQDRVTDHRTKQNFSRVREIIKGTEAFSDVVQSLQKYNREERLMEIVCDL